MRIGLVYDLRDDYIAEGFSPEEAAECDAERTIAAIATALTNRGWTVDRVGHAKKLIERLVAGDRWDLVFNISEGMYGRGRESLVPALLDAYQIPYTFSDPVTMAVTLDKAIAKCVVAEAGVPTAPFAAVRSQADLKAIDLPYPLFIKPLCEGSSKGVSARSRVEDRTQLLSAGGDLLARYPQGILVETYLPGREFTVGLLGSGTDTRVVGVLETEPREQADAAWFQTYTYKQNCEELAIYKLANDVLAKQAAEIAVRSWQALNCFDGGRVDVRCNAAGVLCFIEANPLAGMNPGYSDFPILAEQAGMSYDALIAGFVEAAMVRLGLTEKRSRHAS